MNYVLYILIHNNLIQHSNTYSCLKTTFYKLHYFLNNFVDTVNNHVHLINNKLEILLENI